MNRRSTKCSHAFRRASLPLLSYYAVTIAFPLANGAAQSAAFAGHALVVLVVPLLVVVFACAVHTIARTIWATVCVRRVRM